MRDLVQWLARGLVEKKEAVKVETIERDRSTVFELTVDPDDLGRIIGRGGRTAKAMRTVMKLNRLFFMKTLGGYLAEGGMGAYIPAGDANRHTSKYAMLRELDAAGYEYSKEISLSPFFDAVIMVPKAP